MNMYMDIVCIGVSTTPPPLSCQGPPLNPQTASMGFQVLIPN